MNGGKSGIARGDSVLNPVKATAGPIGAAVSGGAAKEPLPSKPKPSQHGPGELERASQLRWGKVQGCPWWPCRVQEPAPSQNGDPPQGAGAAAAGATLVVFLEGAGYSRASWAWLARDALRPFDSDTLAVFGPRCRTKRFKASVQLAMREHEAPPKLMLRNHGRRKFEFGGQKYIKDTSGALYDPETKRKVGIYDVADHTVFLEDRQRWFEEEETVQRCICGKEWSAYGGRAIQCGKCERWYHWTCAGLRKSTALDPDYEFTCAACEEHCLCRRGMAAYGGFMVQCDGCDHWFHGKCVGVKKGATRVAGFRYFCPACTAARAEAARLAARDAPPQHLGNLSRGLPDELIVQILCCVSPQEDVGVTLLSFMRTCKSALALIEGNMAALMTHYSGRFGSSFVTSEEIYLTRYNEQKRKSADLLALAGWRVPHRLTQTEEGWYRCSAGDTLAHIAVKHGLSVAALERQNAPEFVDRSERHRRLLVTRQTMFQEGTAIWIPPLAFDREVRAEERAKEEAREQAARQESAVRQREVRDPVAAVPAEGAAASSRHDRFVPGDRVAQAVYSLGTVQSVSVCPETGVQLCTVKWDEYSPVETVPSAFLRRDVMPTNRL
eukprot:CAMPEP_0194296114 /NCGR_PEP_ID=MMETSP0169-20130528/55200_1 /TAXON_ID=218684 /ORGANISM="Corethron pennatum, Strain L29A3" /LENGTH=609 /DNA_ID=CAMNT_0039045483 /DNA_START=100 /DNA_END=1926 /DNA_ORIENTATION=+